MTNDDEQSRRGYPIILSSPVRYAIVAPGPVEPLVIASSDDGYSDFVGYYVIRESGFPLEKFSEHSARDQEIYSSFLKKMLRDKPNTSQYTYLDYWSDKISIRNDDRRKLFSLIVEFPLDMLAESKASAVRGALDLLLKEIVDAYSQKQSRRIEARLRPLIAIVSIAKKDLEARSISRERAVRAFMFLIAGYFAFISLVGTVWFFLRGRF
jgi:hypothetical protein